MSKLIILQTCVPDYRKKVFETIKNELGSSFVLYGGASYFEDSIKTDETIEFLEGVQNQYSSNRKALWQSGMWSKCINADMLVLEMNPRIISNWALLIIRMFSGRKTVLWGHAWPRNGADSYSDILRNRMRLLATKIIVYTKSQAKELRVKMPNAEILSAPNALLFKVEMTPGLLPSEAVKNIVYVGRLTVGKKVLFLVESFINALHQLPIDTNLLIVGEGEEQKKIRKLIADNNVSDRIILFGHISDYSTLRDLYATSICSVSPGYVGLSITQSFGFGVPMLISKNENHSPEIEAVSEGVNSLYFDTGDSADLKLKLLSFFNNQDFWLNQRVEISDECKLNYSVESMAQTFISLL